MSRDWTRDNPEADAEAYARREPEIVGYCETCGSPIYRGLTYIDLQTVLLHDEFECKIGWIDQFKTEVDYDTL